jgi:hypothetical protein
VNRLEASVDRVAAETGFSGVVRVDRGDDVQLAKAYGLAHRGYQIANAVDTRFAIASGTKGLTALTVVKLIEEDRLEPATTARSVLGEDLPLIDDQVTVEQLLAHRSGIGDFLDEETGYGVTDYVLPVPVHELATTEQYLRVLDGHPAKFAPDGRFSYSNSGYVAHGRSRSTSRSSSPREGTAPAPLPTLGSWPRRVPAPTHRAGVSAHDGLAGYEDRRRTISTWGRRCRGRSSRPRTAGKPTTGCRGDRR